MSWLDPHTQELLEGVPPRKRAPPKTSEFGLVLIRKGADERRLMRAISRINACDEEAAATQAARPAPVFVNLDLSYSDALLGQFELVCCDAVAAFLASEVLEQGDPRYLATLFARIRDSVEFRPTLVRILEIPRNDEGERFADQFLGVEDLALLTYSLELTAPFKKARIMAHWAARIGGRVELE